MKNIVIIGGGTGTFTLLSGLRKFPTNNSVIVSSADDGGSTGRLRKDLDVFPPGDLRQCLVGLSYTEEHLKELFNFRFDRGELKGHTAGNIIMAALEKITGSVDEALVLAAKILNVRGAVVPVTLKPTLLTAILANGRKIIGEHNIDEPPSPGGGRKGGGGARIKDLQLKPNGPANPRAVQILKNSDVIVFGPGDLFTSILPNLLAKGIRESIDSSRAKKVLVVSLMTKRGQTDGFSAADFATELNRHLGKKKLDAVIVNTKKPDAKVLAKYKKTGAEFVEPARSLPKAEVIAADLLSHHIHQKINGDKLQRSILRHDSDKLARLIYEL
ncbi:MAG: YvcK family protein [Candidatus Doudnabacteria bacterium]|nr:YvcK family protein [Candidatus Doudnabacteria bacterium]